jgi:hypothetical protein
LLEEFLNKFLSSTYTGAVFTDKSSYSRASGTQLLFKTSSNPVWIFFPPSMRMVYLLTFRSTPHITKLH